MQCVFEEKSKYWHPHLHCLSIWCYAMNVSNTFKAQRERNFFCVTRSIKIKDKHFIESYNIFLFYIIAATKQDLKASKKITEKKGHQYEVFLISSLRLVS